MSRERILLIEDDDGLRELLVEELEADGYHVTAVASIAGAQTELKGAPPALVISDLRLPDGNGMTLLPQLQSSLPRPGVLIITAFGTVRQAVEALRAGADDFITKPIDFDHLQLSVQRLLEQQRLQAEISSYRELLTDKPFHGMLGSSVPMRSLVQEIRQIAPAGGPVLVLGESGTGKELVARAIHAESPRANAPFLAVNCGGIPSELMESEFFGHKAGAFTGARNQRGGLLQEANGGTLLLDEIGEMPLALQAKLLRVLQDGRLRPVGSDQEIEVDVRILAATHHDLEQAVSAGDFREDLYYRLETFALRVPPLRERGEDWLQLANFFLARQPAAGKGRIRGFSDDALNCLRGYPFPGNVRELGNIMERAVTFCEGGLITSEHLPARVKGHQQPPEQPLAPGLPREKEWHSLETHQRRYVDQVMAHTKGNKRRAAQILGVTRRTLYRWLDHRQQED
ncbi:sigma-54-dependent Fis family transcriptional regulator [Kineobactrum sediminis]|uniref:Sigma-54-dependent Fis family transcriptional regulator n=1 Tax=Kineobactrum sediminis TaxID=1905677 RepID=A0A2N5Y7M8_9GAMM|nr:sigma-54 dependent transcriptional regulator [Kineobactrum sediminis]PLW84379.1 sigma-54-dependent Fis family transcriptional regulator [Kineobactrum sediminis]